ncbi:hypothetical protein AX016_0308 [Cellulophaga sp. RHA19]|uniref:hypothetical protein n=1 Tax=Cellulophaga sp. RHA19 TaxID=1798237 RepID=UPI000C2C0C19|nr:hypothetical protein [Cellulophaga sp. RHA19]PKB42147.1 hypothetical protein AX016_0308 [Cellulophaga sp. RHA19]
MKINYREDLNKVEIIDNIKSQKSNGKVFSVLIILSSSLNIINNQSNLLFYLSIALLIASISYAIYMFTKKSYKETYNLSEIAQLKTIKIFSITYYRFQLSNKKHRDLEVSKQSTTVAELIDFCKQHKIKIED